MARGIGKILVAATGKGGAGKTTSIACLAIYWHLAGKKVALFDVDANQTLTRWHASGNALSEMTLHSSTDETMMIAIISELASGHDITLVDCAGISNQAMIFAVGTADLVLIPAMADEANVFEATRMRRIVENVANMTKKPIKFRSLLCRVKRAVVASHARSQLEALGAHPLETQLHDRVIFQEATFHGSSPTVLAPKSGAAHDIGELAKEVELILWRRSAKSGDRK